MKVEQCDWEGAVLETLQAGCWPGGCDDELRSHVAQCANCTEVVMVAQVLRQADAAARAEARLPAPGLVWWKAQIRARRAAAERASEPIAIVESVAGVCGVLSLLALAIWQWSRIASWWKWLRTLPFATSLWAADTPPHLSSANLTLLMGLALCLALVSFVLYLVFAEK